MLLKELLDVLEEAVKECIEDEVKECDPQVQKLYAASKEFISRNLTKLSYNDLHTARATSKALTKTIEYALKVKKEKEEKEEKEKEE